MASVPDSFASPPSFHSYLVFSSQRVLPKLARDTESTFGERYEGVGAVEPANLIIGGDSSAGVFRSPYTGVCRIGEAFVSLASSICVLLLNSSCSSRTCSCNRCIYLPISVPFVPESHTSCLQLLWIGRSRKHMEYQGGHISGTLVVLHHTGPFPYDIHYKSLQLARTLRAGKHGRTLTAFPELSGDSRHVVTLNTGSEFDSLDGRNLVPL